MKGSVGEEMPTFKCLLIGDGNVGKSCLIERHLSGKYEKEYEPTSGVKCHPMIFNTSRGKIQLIVWDMAGQKQLKKPRLCYHGSDCAIIMFDRTSISSYKSVSNWHRDVITTCGHIPMVLIGNKLDVDADERVVKAESIVFHKKNNMKYYDMSIKKLLNYEKPFLSLIREIVGDDELQLIPIGDIQYKDELNAFSIKNQVKDGVKDNGRKRSRDMTCALKPGEIIYKEGDSIACPASCSPQEDLVMIKSVLKDGQDVNENGFNSSDICLLIGHGNVGKSSLIERDLSGKYKKEYGRNLIHIHLTIRS